MKTTADMRRFHYELERRLAERVRTAPVGQRSAVTRTAYNELLQKVPWHPEFHVPVDERRRQAAGTAARCARHIQSAHVIADLGCGNGQVLQFLAQKYPDKRFMGVDISDVFLEDAERPPPNLALAVGDIVDPPILPGSVDIALSSHVVEHLHPEHVPRHLAAVLGLLRPGGVYYLETPNRASGPHDVSKGFDRVATGFHLKEWTYGELALAFRAAGFVDVRCDVPVLAFVQRRLGLGSDSLLAPAGAKAALERALWAVPPGRVQYLLGRALRLHNVGLYARRPTCRPSGAGRPRAPQAWGSLTPCSGSPSSAIRPHIDAGAGGGEPAPPA